MKLSVISITIDTAMVGSYHLRGKATLQDREANITLSVPISPDVINLIVETVEADAAVQLSDANKL